MKKLILVLAIGFFASMAMANPFLVCDDPDPAEQVTSYEIFQDGVSLGITPAPMHFDLQGIAPGSYEFTAKAINDWGSESAISNPYISPTSATPPLNINMNP